MVKKENEGFAFPSWVKVLVYIVGVAVGVTVWGMIILANVNTRIDDNTKCNTRQDQRLDKLESNYETNLKKILENTEEIVKKLEK
jgi:hypothetical protein